MSDNLPELNLKQNDHLFVQNGEEIEEAQALAGWVNDVAANVPTHVVAEAAVCLLMLQVVTMKTPKDVAMDILLRAFDRAQRAMAAAEQSANAATGEASQVILSAQSGSTH